LLIGKFIIETKAKRGR